MRARTAIATTAVALAVAAVTFLFLIGPNGSRIPSESQPLSRLGVP